jgi:two-component system LytT family response regulator
MTNVHTNKIKAIIVDDEESARDVFENLVTRFCPEIELVAKCTNVLDAVESIKKIKPDVVFLDIEMPKYAGYEIVNFFEEINFEIIFVTAYDKYALRAFEISAVDYLLKPIDIDRLKLAVSKVKNRFDLKESKQRLSILNETLKTNTIKNIIVIDKGYQHIVPIGEIIAIEAQESYCNIYLKDKKYIVSKNLKYYENVFAELDNFFRTHKSWMISKNHIVNYSKSELIINLSGEIIAKLSKYKKIEFEELIA